MNQTTTQAPIRETAGADLIVIGAGIVGLAHAYHAARAGLRVIVLDRDEAAVGASVRNFGHICTTGQAGLALEYARDAREDWLAIGQDAGLTIERAGAVVVARTPAELRVLDEFAADRGGDAARILDAGEAGRAVGFTPPGLLGGAHLPMDLRVDPLTATADITRYLLAHGVDIRPRTTALSIEPGLVRTTRGDLRADRVVVCVGHDVDRFFPDLADGIALLRCRLRMLEIEAPGGIRIEPAVLTGLSLLRYDGFAAMPSADDVRQEIAERRPELLTQAVNLMLTQRPDGRVILGDTHHSAVTETPFEDESSDALLLDEFARLFGTTGLTVRRRWRGVYASSAQTPFLVAEPLPGVTVASVTTGIGMTTAFGFARAVLERRGATPPTAGEREPATTAS